MARFVGIRAPGASKRRTSAETAAAFLASYGRRKRVRRRLVRSIANEIRRQAAARDSCTLCGIQRNKNERGWRWIYPDAAPPHSLEPLAVVCPACAQDDPPLTDREVR